MEKIPFMAVFTEEQAGKRLSGSSDFREGYISQVYLLRQLESKRMLNDIVPNPG
jgi:hypothetical protein